MWALARAEDAVSRVDERVRACSFRRGWIARLDFSEAVAWGWNAGRVVSTEDLLLHEASMDVRMPDAALRAAHGVIAARRKALAGGAEILSPAGAAWLVARQPRPPSPAGAELGERRHRLESAGPLTPQLLALLTRLQSGTTEDCGQAVAEWLGLLGLSDKRLPLLLQAAVALEGWTIIDPYPRESHLGPLLVAHWLKLQKRVRSHLFGFEAGIREMRRRNPSWRTAPLQHRILFWLDIIGESAAQAGEALNRLELARQVALKRIGPRRAHSHLGALLDLFLEWPLVTAPMAAQKLKVSPQTTRRMIADLGSCLTEVSGQRRYRAWRL